MILLLHVTASRSAPASTVLFHASFDDTLEAESTRGAVKPAQVDGKVEYRAGKVGRALLCGGDAANLKYPVEGNVRPRQGTVMMWVQAVDWPEGEQAFHVFFETDGPGWLVLYKFWTSGLLMLSGIDQAHYSSAYHETYSINNGEWHHLAGTWKKDRLAFFDNGKLIRSHSLPSLPQELRGFFNVGDRPWSKPHESHTLLDDVTVYRYALPDDQIAVAAQGKPVTFQPSVHLDIEPHPAKQQWRIAVDGSGFVGDDGPGTQAKIEVVTNGKTTASSRVDKFVDGMAFTALDISKVPTGPQVVRATLLDAAGKEVARAEVPVEKPAEAPWMNTKVGLDDRVLPPFTEIRVGGVRAVAARKPAGKSVECWGRKYVMDGPFPTQIESAGQAMLAAPVRLSLATQSGEVAFQKNAGKIGGWSPTRANHSGSAEAPNIKLETKSVIEYDGMLWTDVTLTPKQPTRITNLTINVPMRAANAVYIHHAAADWGGDNAGFLPQNGYESANFQPYIWLGDDDRGLAWFADSQKSWSNVGGQTVQRVVRNGDRVEMQIQVINLPTEVTEPLRFSFGFQATPVKAIPRESQGWRLGNLGTAENLNDPSMGNIQVVWCNGNLVHYGYPWPKDPEKFRKLVAELHAKKILVVPYVNLNFMSTGAPEWNYYSADWRDAGRSFSGGDVGEMGSDLIGACPQVEAWRDFIAYKIAKFVDEFQVDGIYIDCWNPYPCVVEEHGCGWRDAAGNLRGRVPMLGMREVVRRVREVFADRRPNFHLIIHMSADVVMPMLAFADSMLDGEQYQGERAPKDDYLSIVPLDKWRAENTGGHWGVFPFFLPEFTGKARIEPLATERLAGIMLAHGASPWPIWCKTDVIFDAWKTLDKFGVVDAEFVPYWRPNGVTVDNKEVLVSLYRKPGKTMLVVLNSGKDDASVALKVDTKQLGLSPTFVAKNAADGSVTNRGDDGTLKLKIPGRGYQLVAAE